eukprot:8985069-Pyramimonas_sp.AAC.2
MARGRNGALVKPLLRLAEEATWRAGRRLDPPLVGGWVVTCDEASVAPTAKFPTTSLPTVPCNPPHWAVAAGPTLRLSPPPPPLRSPQAGRPPDARPGFPDARPGFPAAPATGAMGQAPRRRTRAGAGKTQWGGCRSP